MQLSDLKQAKRLSENLRKVLPAAGYQKTKPQPVKSPFKVAYKASLPTDDALLTAKSAERKATEAQSKAAEIATLVAEALSRVVNAEQAAKAAMSHAAVTSKSAEGVARDVRTIKAAQNLTSLSTEEVEAIAKRMWSELEGTEEVTEAPQVSEDLVREIIKVMRKLPDQDKIEVQDIRNAQSFLFNGTRYKTSELMHGAGSSTGGGGITLLAISGTIDDTNVTFSAASEPTLLNINGGLYAKTGGSITWSYAGGTITLSSAVGTGGSIAGLI